MTGKGTRFTTLFVLFFIVNYYIDTSECALADVGVNLNIPILSKIYKISDNEIGKHTDEESRQTSRNYQERRPDSQSTDYRDEYEARNINHGYNRYRRDNDNDDSDQDYYNSDNNNLFERSRHPKRNRHYLKLKDASSNRSKERSKGYLNEDLYKVDDIKSSGIIDDESSAYENQPVVIKSKSKLKSDYKNSNAKPIIVKTESNDVENNSIEIDTLNNSDTIESAKPTYQQQQQQLSTNNDLRNYNNYNSFYDYYYTNSDNNGSRNKDQKNYNNRVFGVDYF